MQYASRSSQCQTAAAAHPPTVLTTVALLDGASCSSVTLLKVAWSGEQVRVHQKCRKLCWQAGQPTMKGMALPVCRQGRSWLARLWRHGCCGQVMRASHVGKSCGDNMHASAAFVQQYEDYSSWCDTQV